MLKNELDLVLGFGEFTVHRRERSVRKSGVRLKLHGQSFEILLLLIEHPGQVVTREELQAKLWHGDVFVDFENGLNAAVKKLRQTLGDSAESPRYIETLPRVGYRFLVPVIQIESRKTEQLPPIEPPPKAPIATPAIVQTFGGFRRGMLPALSVLLLVSCAVVWFHRNSALALNPADLVLVSDFVNTTGEPVFDDTLKRALSVKLSESPQFNILNEYNLRETLRLMERSPADKLLPPLDREVCQRAGAKVSVGGSIIALRDQYVIALDARNCLNNAIVAHEEGRSPNRDQVLLTLGNLIQPLRRKLGESVATIEKFNTPIQDATTPSLSALKAYTLGDEARLQGQNEESVSFYRLAIELDPNFAIAYARLGTVYGNLSRRDLDKQFLQKAFDHRGHVSEKEKFYIVAHYYTEFTLETEKSIQTYELWTQAYPNDWIPFNNLADVAARNGLNDKAIPAGQQALRLNPNGWFAYGTLANAYLRASRFAEAQAICDRAVRENHVGMTMNTALRVALVQGDQTVVDKLLQNAKGKPNEAIMLTYAAAANADKGKLRDSRKFAADGENVAVRNGLQEQASNTAYDESLAEVELGFPGQARKSVAQALGWNPDPSSRGYAAMTFARLGDIKRAEAYIKIADIKPLDTIHNAVVLASARAAIELNRKNPKQAIEDLNSALPYDLGEFSNGQTLYLRGLAYLDEGLPKDAEAQFQKLIDNHGATISVYWPLAHLGLARSYASGGETQKALEAYDNFFALWKDADADLPALRQVRLEYQKLTAP